MSQNVNSPIPLHIPGQDGEFREQVILENQGKKIFGIFHKPRGLSRYPAVLICHGLGGHKVGRFRLYVDLAESFAEAGIATLRIDFRGCGDSEGAFADMTLKGQVSDTLLGLRYLDEHPEVDSDRIGLVGRSFGGAISVIAASQFSKIKSLVLWAPVYDATTWIQQWHALNDPNVPEAQKHLLMTINGQIGSYAFYKEFFEMRIDPYLPVLRKQPMLLIHGLQDVMVKLEHSERYLKARIGASGVTKLVQLPRTDHDFSNLEERFASILESTNWLKKTL